MTNEVSIAETLLRTVGLVGLTVIFAAVFRFWKPAIHLSQKVAGTSAWQALYGLFHIETALGREQLILIGIVLVCFLAALGVEVLILASVRRIRKQRQE
ncbi:hypothetical protein GMO_14480 [Gluconobacter morbifer G707]|uniref:Uncharacterized protein n=1 Tax=Gluconobacter morbifer G707 TaxID=1088869 RepID=G6XIN8_9PROT|nr:hypothetical protein GMO_14480 [Gluconobacter morbifer G707]